MLHHAMMWVKRLWTKARSVFWQVYPEAQNFLVSHKVNWLCELHEWRQKKRKTTEKFEIRCTSIMSPLFIHLFSLQLSLGLFDWQSRTRCGLPEKQSGIQFSMYPYGFKESWDYPRTIRGEFGVVNWRAPLCYLSLRSVASPYNTISLPTT